MTKLQGADREGSGGLVCAHVPGQSGGWRVRFFSDGTGFVEMNGTTYFTFYVKKLVQAELSGFTSATKLVTGEYRFRVRFFLARTTR